MTAGVQIEMMCLQEKECQGLLTSSKVKRGQEVILWRLKRMWDLSNTDFELKTSTMV